MNKKNFIYPDASGKPWANVSAEQLWADVYALKFNRPEKTPPAEVWSELFRQALEAAREFGAQTIDCRIRLEYEPQLFRQLLQGLGFTKRSGRIEYQLEIERLPFSDGSPVTWKTAKELGWSLEEIKDFTKEIIEGALDVDPNENPEDFIKDWLSHDEYTSGPDCIAIGFLDGRSFALSVAQVETATGWSRISYMGMIPSFRGKGLGKWVHRQGFTMMKAQGGKLYHGGTHVQNLPMRKLFESHGCRVFCEMEEWSMSFKEEA